MRPLSWKLILLATFLPFFSLAQTPKKSDRDGDGIKNRRDHCPDEAGLASLFGCPDSDNDGVIDKRDLCPLDAGLEYLLGCPDRDDDGISDLFDECPDTPGRADRKGCPDRDADGIVDDLDLCPDTPGSNKAFGCPDMDDDGVADQEDRCPDLPGSPSAKGCPDSDNDGISDDVDRCPKMAGLPDLGGCPEIQPADRDFLARSAERLQFDKGSASLTPVAMAYLDQLAAMMENYPDFQLRLSAHTDTGGSFEEAQRLTELRADACRTYLLKKGVPASRISAHGYGSTMPVANNLFPEGRQRNIRVEAELETK